MYKILRKVELSPDILELDIEAPRVAKKALPGQFIVLRVNDEGERVPLTIADFDREKGTITILFQVVGASTELLASIEEGDAILDFVGPLGQPSEISEHMGTVVFVGGGIGVAPVYPIARAVHELGNKVISILGAKTKDILIFEDRMRAISDEVLVTTDDGSYGIKGFVTNAMEELIKRGEKIDQVTAIGPGIMMKSVAEATRPHGIKTIVSLNPIMVDGTGMCGACRLTVGDEIKFACVDGPEFDGHLIDFDEAMKRQQIYKTAEGREMLKILEGDTHHGGCGYCGGDK